MGCTCSSLQFRDIYNVVQEILAIDSKQSAYTLSPPPTAIEQRSRVFASIGAVGNSTVASNTPEQRSTQARFPCAPSFVSTVQLLRYSREQWKLNQIHPYCLVLPQRLSAALVETCSIASAGDGGDALQLPRWLFRPYLLAEAEFFHALAILQEGKALPGKALKWFRKMESANKDFFAKGADGALTSEARKALRTCDELSITRKELTPKLLGRLENEMPGVLTSTKGPGRAPIPASVDGVLAAVKDYYEERKAYESEHSAKHDNRPDGANPFSITASATAGCTKDSVPLVAFVQWVALRYALSFNGVEEEPTSFWAVSSPSAAQDSAERDVAEVTEEVKLEREPCRLEKWRVLLKRLSELDCKLGKEEPEGLEERRQMQAEKAEKAALEGELRQLFSRLSDGEGVMHQSDARDKTYEEFRLGKEQCEQPLNQRLSDCAFRNANPVPVQEGVRTLAEFRRFLTAYLALHVLYDDARGFVSSDGDSGKHAASPLSFASLWSLLQKSGGRNAYLVEYLPSEMDLKAQAKCLFRSLSRGLVDAAGGAAVDFYDLCAFAAQWSAGVLHELSELKSYLGIVNDGDGTLQTRRIFNAVTRLNGDDVRGCSDTTVCVALDSIHIASFCSSHQLVSSAVAQYASGAAGAAGEPSEQQRSRWLRALHHEAGLPSAERTFANTPHSRFFAYSVYCATAVLRAFENAADDTLDECCRRPALGPTTAVDFIWFNSGLRRCAQDLECSVESLVAFCPEWKAVKEGSNPADYFLLNDGNPDTASSIQNRGERCGAALAFQVLGFDRTGFASTAPLVDVVQLCLFNYTRAHFSKEAEFSVYLQRLRGCLEGVDKNAVLQQLLKAMPLQSERQCYVEFFRLSHGQRMVLESTESDVNIGRFTHGLFKRYQTYLTELLSPEPSSESTPESLFTSLCCEALRHVTSTSPQNSEGGLAVDLYGAFLYYLIGRLITTTTFNSWCESGKLPPSSPSDAPSNGALGGVGEDFIAALLAHPFASSLPILAGEDEAGERDAGKVFRVLQPSEGDGSKAASGRVAVGKVAAWFASWCAARVAFSAVEQDWWRRFSTSIPYTCSREHREGRRAIVAAVRGRVRAAQQKDGAGRAMDDGYLPTSLLGDVLNERYELGRVPRCCCLSLLEASAVAAESDTNPLWRVWLEDCVSRTNVVALRDDLAGREIHHTDLRFLLQYVHHALTTVRTVGAAQKEVDGRARANEGTLSETSSDVEEVPLTLEDREYLDAVSRVLDALHASKAAKEEVDYWIGELNTSPAGDTQLTGTTSRMAEKEAGERDRLRRLEAAHCLTAVLVRRTRERYRQAQEDFMEEVETVVLDEHRREKLLGQHLGKGASDIASYWERLRFLLPRGNSQEQRKRRRELFFRLDTHQHGYLTLPDLHRGLIDVLNLNAFRSDIAPVLFRAFFAAKETALEREDSVFITKSNEQVLKASEFRAFLTYLYGYMELYFMFDVLTCSLHVNNNLHIVPCRVVDLVVSAGPGKGTRQITPGDALCAAAESPYQLTLEAASVDKVVTLAQFEAAVQLLRLWGISVQNPAAVFGDVNRRCREEDEMYFTAFAIWASELELHPEGYGHGFYEDVDQLAILEERYAAAEE